MLKFMMNVSHGFFLILFCLLNVYDKVYSQTRISDSSDDALLHAIKVYHNAAGDQSGIYNGSQYFRYPNPIFSGHPYFLTDSLTMGSVFYDGILYKDVLLLYDEITDQLITKDMSGYNLVSLIKDRITHFNISGHHFINISDKSGLPAPGYYRVLYDGRSQVLVKETKSVLERPINSREIERVVYPVINYYIRSGAQYYRFNNIKSLLPAFGEHQKAIRDFIKKKRLRFRSNKEDVISQLVTFYDQLIN